MSHNIIQNKTKLNQIKIDKCAIDTIFFFEREEMFKPGSFLSKQNFIKIINRWRYLNLCVQVATSYDLRTEKFRVSCLNNFNSNSAFVPLSTFQSLFEKFFVI